MECQRGHGMMTLVGKFWFCGVCGERIENAPGSHNQPQDKIAGSDLNHLPSPIAIPWDGFLGEQNPFLRLHRLCDAAEVTVRFLTIVALGETRRGLGGVPLPGGLLDKLQPNIERPTFGRWWAMLRALSGPLAGRSDLVIPELPVFIKEALAPLLEGEDPHQSLIVLRNDIHHSGGTPLATAQHFLDGWTLRTQSLLDALAFLADTEVSFMQGDHSYPLAGPLSPTGPSGAGRVALHRGIGALDLWPLCDYGPALPAPNAVSTISMPSGPRIFLRAEPDRLLFAALGMDPWQGESRDALAGFRDLFRLNQQKSPASEAPADFEQEIRADADALIGRSDDLKQAKGAIKGAQTGVLWIGGPGGMGKSYLMAKLASDLGNGKDCRLVWRFRNGDAARCSRDAFLRYAVELLSQWKPLQTEEGHPTTTDPIALRQHLAELLDRAAALPAPNPRAKPPRVLFFLDGLDEIERLDPDFAHLPFDLVRPNVVWVCAGRPERTLTDVFVKDRCRHVFPDGLPPMSENDIRAMLLDETGPFKYALLAQDTEAGGGVSNLTLAAISQRAEGLPLYVRLVIGDIVSGHFAFGDLAQKLPPSLNDYYDDLLRRLGIGDLQALLTPLVVTIAWALAPLDEETLLWLMEERQVLDADEEPYALLRSGLNAVGSMIRMAHIADGAFGYESYHLTFREHIKADTLGNLKNENSKASKQFCRMTTHWTDIPKNHPARHYALQFGPQHLYDAQRWDDLYTLARSAAFLDAQATALFEDPDAPLRTLRTALQGAMAQDNAAKMGEFVILHARRLRATTQETPLAALRNGSLERAWRLADLHDVHKQVLWHLLLAWELKDAGRDAERKETVRRISVQELPTLDNQWASYLLIKAINLDEPEFLQLSQKLTFQDNQFLEACQYMAAEGHVASAKQCAHLVQDTGEKMKALQAVISAQIDASDFQMAFQTLSSFSRRFPEAALDAALSIVRAALRVAERTQAVRAFRFATHVLHIGYDQWNEWFKILQAARVALARATIGYDDNGEQFIAEIDFVVRFEQATEVARELTDAEDRVEALITIATATAEDKNLNLAKDTFRLARGAVESMTPITNLQLSRNLHYRLRDIAQAQIQAGLVEEGLETQEAALEAIRRSGDIKDIDYGQSIFPEAILEYESRRLREYIGRTLSETGHLEAAQRIAREINSPSLLASTLSRLGLSQAKAGMAAESLETFADAVRTARRLPDDYLDKRPDALAEIALARVKLGDASVARDIFAESFQSQEEDNEAEVGGSVLASFVTNYIHEYDIPSAMRLALRMTGRWRDDALLDIVKAQVDKGLMEEAQETLSKFSDRAYKNDFGDGRTVRKDDALSLVTYRFIDRGELASAYRVIEQMQDAFRKNSDLSDLVEAYAKRGEFQQAEEIASLIQHGDDINPAKQYIAEAKPRWEQPQETSRSENAPVKKKKMLDVSDIQSIENRDKQSHQYWLLANQLANEGRFGEVVQAVKAAIHAILQYDNQFEAFDATERTDVIRDVLLHLANADLSEEMLTLFRRLMREPASQIWPTEKEGELSKGSNEVMQGKYLLMMVVEIIRSQARSGRFEQAQQTVEEMSSDFWRNFADAAGDDINIHRTYAMCEIAEAYIASNNRVQAERTLDAARECARAIKDRYTRFGRVGELYRVAMAQARYAFGAAALKTSGLLLAEGEDVALNPQDITVDFCPRGVWLPSIARYFALHKDATNFKYFLAPCANSRETAYEMCRQLTWLYPDQVNSIVEMVSSVSSQLSDQEEQ